LRVRDASLEKIRGKTVSAISFNLLAAIIGEATKHAATVSEKNNFIFIFPIKEEKLSVLAIN